MEKELIEKSLELFSIPEKWNAFLELSFLKDKIIEHWKSKLKKYIIEKIDLPEAWDFNQNGMQWYLKEFGNNSLSIWLEGEHFSLYAEQAHYDVDLINNKLKEHKFKSVNDSIMYKDIGFGNGYFFREKGRFEFENLYDNNFDSNRLAWFAGNKPDEYVNQIRKKLQPFFENSTTQLLIELNRISKK
ncbi:MAG: hypothetical protein SGI96_13495 [Bacteroidota bacterium]|nr:hypothetical protein [Bacteroidota bacterium]